MTWIDSPATSVPRETLGDGFCPCGYRRLGSPVPDGCATCWQRSEGYDQNDGAPAVTPSQLAPVVAPLFAYDEDGHPV